MRAEALKGHLGGLLLSMLEPGPLHGYAVIEKLKLRSGGRLALPTGTVYPALQRLQRQELVSSSWSSVGGRRRRTYTLTNRGRRALIGERGSWQEFVATIGTVLEGIPWSRAG